MSFDAFLSAVVAQLAEKLPDGVSVEAHGGTFDLEELKRVALKAPAVRVCLMGTGKGQRATEGEWSVPLNLAAAVITRDSVGAGAKVDRGMAAAALATAVTLVVQGYRFGLAGVGQPEDLIARNEYSGKLDATGVAIWQVTWTQTLLIGDGVDESIAALTSGTVNGDPLFPVTP